MNAQVVDDLLRRVRLSGAPPRGEDPGGLFRGIRRRLTLWYTGAMFVALLLLGAVLYGTMRYTLLNPVQNSLEQEAAQIAQAWTPLIGCPPMRDGGLLACYDRSGQLNRATPLAQISAHFTDSGLALAALRNGSAQDTVNGGPGIGVVERYALVVREPDEGPVGVVMVGAPIGDDLHALNVLLLSLLGLGALVLLLSAAGGLFLADRALLPAKVAYGRQRTFIADASHELRTPLTMLRADADVLLRDRNHFPADDAALLEDMVRETAHMSSLADTMLDLARLDAAEVHLEQDVADLREIAEDVLRRAGARAAEEGVALHLEGAPVLVIGDRLLLEQALLALVDNGIKYNRPGGTVAVRLWEGDGSAHLEVRDTGIGIPPEHLDRLGERFYRVDKARSRAQGGAGLGLSLVQRIVERHGGSVRIESGPGNGTTVHVTLPGAHAPAR